MQKINNPLSQMQMNVNPSGTTEFQKSPDEVYQKFSQSVERKRAQTNYESEERRNSNS